MFDSQHTCVKLSKLYIKASFNEIHLDKPYHTGSLISLIDLHFATCLKIHTSWYFNCLVLIRFIILKNCLNVFIGKNLLQKYSFCN